MDFEDELILQAVKKIGSKQRTPKKEVYSFEEDQGEELVQTSKPDALVKIARREKIKTAHKKKLIQDWTMTDFVYFLKSLLFPFGLSIEAGVVQSSTFMGRLYDQLVIYLGDDVNNFTLKEYCEWWTATYAAQYGSHRFHIQAMTEETKLQRFAEYFRGILHSGEHKEPTPETNVSIEEIYKTGSLSMVLMLKGIVLAVHFLQHQSESNVFSKVTETMRKFSRQAIEKTLESTIKCAPYPKSKRIDVGAVISGITKMHNLTFYQSYPWSNLFKGE